MDTDQELWEAIKRSDEQAFSKLFHRYASKIYRHAYSYVRDTEVCEQTVHDIFMTLWVNREKLQVQSFKAYLTSAARYRVYKYITARKVIPIDYKEDLEACENFSILNSGYNNIVCGELEVQIDSSLGSLPKRCQEIFRMSRTQLLSNHEIASKLGISKRTVENQITYALKRLRLAISR